ncbi:MAG: hypothetical protein ACTSYJ_09290 [Candidatus Thorarchaeota archaeon]
MSLVIAILFLSGTVQTISGYSYSRTFDLSNYDLPRDLVVCNDGGFAIAGSTFIEGHDYLLLKTDSSGRLDWIHTYGTGSHEYVKSLAECSDGGFLILGYRGHGNPWIVRTDSYGRQLWNQTVHHENGVYDTLNDIKELPNGDLIAAGSVRETGLNYTSAWLVKLDNNGSLMWSRTFSNVSQHQICKSLILCQNGDFMLLGDTANNGYNLQNLWMLRMTDSGQVIWQKTFIKDGNEAFSAATEASSGGFAITGTWDDGWNWEYRMFLLRINSSGTLMWNKNYTGSEQHLDPGEPVHDEATAGRDVIECDDHGFVILGATNSFDSFFPKNIWVVRTNEFGVPLWINTVKRDSSESPKSIAKRTQYEDFIVLSHTRESVISNEYDILLTFIDDEAPDTPTTTTTTELNEIYALTIAGVVSAGAIAVIVLYFYRVKRSSSINENLIQ